MVVQPVVGAQRADHFEQRQRAVFERDAGVLGLRAFLVDRVPHQPGEQRRGRRAVVDRRDGAAGAPPGVGARVGRRVVAARRRCARRRRSGPGRCAGRSRRAGAARWPCVAQHLAQRACCSRSARCRRRTGRRGWWYWPPVTAAWQARRAVLLRRSAPIAASFSGVGGHVGGQQQRVQLVVAGVRRQRLREVVEVAVQVDVLVRRRGGTCEKP